MEYGPSPALTQGFHAPADEHSVPCGPVLVGEEYRFAAGAGTGGQTRGLELEQRGQTVDLGLRRHQASQDACQPERVLAQGRPGQVVSGSGRVTLVEDEIDDLENGREAGGPLGAQGNSKGTWALARVRLARTMR